MLNKSIKIEAQPPKTDPSRVFETAMAQLQRGKERHNPSQMPICMRPRKEQPVTEKQMVTDAARALALLWKVAPSVAR